MRIRIHHWLVCCSLVSLGSLAWASTAQTPAVAEPVTITAQHQGRRVDIRMLTQVTAPLQAIWDTLTDYENTPKWVPDMDSSVVLSRYPGGAVVQQTGEARVLFFNWVLDVVLVVTEQPPDRLRVRALGGDFKFLDGGYLIKALPDAKDHFELTWEGRMELASVVPGFLAEPMLRDKLQLQFEGVAAEIMRRAQAANH